MRVVFSLPREIQLLAFLPSLILAYPSNPQITETFPAYTCKRSSCIPIAAMVSTAHIQPVSICLVIPRDENSFHEAAFLHVRLVWVEIPHPTSWVLAALCSHRNWFFSFLLYTSFFLQMFIITVNSKALSYAGLVRQGAQELSLSVGKLVVWINSILGILDFLHSMSGLQVTLIASLRRWSSPLNTFWVCIRLFVAKNVWTGLLEHSISPGCWVPWLAGPIRSIFPTQMSDPGPPFTQLMGTLETGEKELCQGTCGR